MSDRDSRRESKDLSSESPSAEDPSSEIEWRRMWEIFHEVVDTPEAERAEHLERLCQEQADDEERDSLRQRVLELVACFERRGDLLDEPERLRFSLLEPGTTGEQIGTWRILDRLGEGGVGVVYRVERTEGGFSQEAALKLLRSGHPGKQQLERFERERQILADLEHPHIARLLDGGSTDGGQPYLVLELVDGSPIDVYCDRHRLDLRSRARLFVKVARAVDAAHRQLIVHRDLKPANILVDRSGEPRLLDFGLARLLSEETAATQTAARMLTPRYASPEQVLGRPVSTASDVYSLGVVLFELLAGASPYGKAATTETPHLLTQAILEHDAPRPSRVAERRGSAVRGSKRLRADLDTVVRTALAKAPERRYPSPGHLADDLERALLGEPLLARPATAAYRFSRFVSRHPLGVGLAAAAIVALSATATIASLQSLRLRQALVDAEQARDEATEVGTFLTELFEVAGDGSRRPAEITAKEVLDRGAARIGSGLADNPLTRARLHHTAGSVYRRLGLYKEAAHQLEAALALREEALGIEHLALVPTLVELARVREVEGALEVTTALYRRALAIGGGEDPLPPLQAARLWAELAAHLCKFNDTGPIAEAETAARSALDRAAAASGAQPLERAAVLESLAEVEHWRNEPERERELLEEVVGVRRGLLGDQHPEVAEALRRLGDVARRTFQDEEAEDLYREAIESFEAVVEPDHRGLASARRSLGHLLVDHERYQEAASLFRTVLASGERTGREGVDWSSAAQGLAVCLLRTGQPEEAEAILREVVADRERQYGRDHVWTVVAFHYLAEALEAQGRSEEAARLPRSSH